MARLGPAWLGLARHGKAMFGMGMIRQPDEIWQITRVRIWQRDGGLCQYPYGRHPVPLEIAHIDHIQSGRGGSNADRNLRVLCPYHHALRADPRHRGLTAWAVARGIVPPNWRELVWDEPDSEKKAGTRPAPYR